MLSQLLRIAASSTGSSDIAQGPAPFAVSAHHTGSVTAPSTKMFGSDASH